MQTWNAQIAAMKSRIAYLSIDLQWNAHFLPDNMLNVRSLVLIVGSQTTQQQAHPSLSEMRV